MQANHEASARLRQISDVMKARGIVDVKLHFNPRAIHTQTSTQCMQGAAEFLQAYLDGQGVVVEGLGDAPQGALTQ